MERSAKCPEKEKKTAESVRISGLTQKTGDERRSTKNALMGNAGDVTELKKEDVVGELQRMLKEQSSSVNEQMSCLSANLQQLTQVMLNNKKEGEEEAKEKELRYLNDHKKLQNHLDTKLKESEERNDSKFEELKHLWVGCVMQLQTDLTPSAETPKKAGNPGVQGNKAVRKASQQKLGSEDTEKGKPEEPLAEDVGLNGIPALSDEVWEAEKLKNGKEVDGTLRWLEEMPEEYSQRFLDPCGVDFGGGSLMTTWSAGEYLALGKNASANKCNFAAISSFEPLMWETQRVKSRLAIELPKFQAFLIHYYRTIKKKDVDSLNVGQTPGYRHQMGVIEAFTKLMDGLSGFYHQTTS